MIAIRKFVALAFLVAAFSAVAAAPVYQDNGDGSVTDKATGLIWQKCSRGQNNDASCSGTTTKANWSTALTYCNTLSLAGKTWRLPNIKELKSIVDRKKASGAAIDTTAFPATVADYYWSASAHVPGTTNAWSVGFNGGGVFADFKASFLYVRCVATGP